MHFIPLLCLHCNGETKIIGVDDAEMGEFVYDYVGIDLELVPWQIYGDNSSTIRGCGDMEVPYINAMGLIVMLGLLVLVTML